MRAAPAIFPMLALSLNLLMWASPVRANPTGADGAALSESIRRLGALDVEGAETAIAPILSRNSEDPAVLFQEGFLRFHRGDYAGAVRNMDLALERSPHDEEYAGHKALRDLVASTRDVTEHFRETRSADGRFVVRYADGPDAILAPYALETLAAADNALTTAIGVRVPGPIRLEIYASPSVLARVSTLTVADIERTGTVALSKWDRLMITSPRALLRGYPWLDTIAHEFTHLVLTRASRNEAPVWVQEGFARYLERRWRGPDYSGDILEPTARAQLSSAKKHGTLLPFERLHPSIALLPSQEQASLAFAQVATFVGQFVRDHGPSALRRVVELIASDMDAKRAFAAAADTTFETLEKAWKDGIREDPTAHATPHALPMRFRQHDDDDADESEDVPVARARRFLRLGDLLWNRGRHGAASIEYEKGVVLAPDDPIIAARFGRAAIDAGHPERAVAALRHIDAIYPEHAPTRAALGRALLATGDLPGARTELREALRLNPFDPEPHCGLAQASDNDVERSRETTFCRQLSTP